jgi:tetratricopeptide (TPR) repeat protein
MQASSAVKGRVCDSNGKPVANANVFLLRSSDTTATKPETRIVQTDAEGWFHISGLSDGTYTLHAEGTGGRRTAVSMMSLTRNETKTVDLVLMPPGRSGSHAALPPNSQDAPPSSSRPEFFDEPQFTVAGVTQAATAGGHGSDTMLRNSEALVKATVSLGKESDAKESSDKQTVAEMSAVKNSTDTSKLQEERAKLQAQILRDGGVRGNTAGTEKIPAPGSGNEDSRQKQSDLHHQLAQIDEKLSDPLEAVREYQRASELAPSETNLFDWASELLTHRALEPATEVFTQGNRLYPQSVRMLIGLGVTWYARGSYDRAAQYLGSASDLDPSNPTPYLFMGKMQSVETVPSHETVERLARYERLQPASALANYYYAIGNWKSRQSEGSLDDATSAQVEALLQKAVALDPKLGPAFLQLGILYAQRGDYARAITAYQKAIEVSPDLEETHYRLAQAYRRTGEEAKAKEQLQLHEQLSKQSKEEAERQRGEIQQFVISLRDKSTH